MNLGILFARAAKGHAGDLASKPPEKHARNQDTKHSECETTKERLARSKQSDREHVQERGSDEPRAKDCLAAK